MSSAAAPRLYSNELLALATELAACPLRDEHAIRADARSRTCGSTLTAGFMLDEAARIAGVGLRVSACAVGQAAAAIFATGAPGRSGREVADALVQIEHWLQGSGAQPEWAGIAALEPARAYPGRHGAIVLPWKAGAAALCNAAEAS